MSPRLVLFTISFALAATACTGTADDGGSVESTSTPLTTQPRSTFAERPTVPEVSAAPTAPSTTPSSEAITTTTSGAPGDLAVALVEVASIEQPVAFAVRTGDPSLYVASQVGQVLAIRDGQSGKDVVLDITDRVEYGGEQGLLGLAFSLDGTKAYVNYTVSSGDGQVDEYSVGDDGVFDAASRRALLTVEHREHANHNGGSTVVGADGSLYLGFGDGGGGGDPFRRGQDPGTLLGKILRIDPTPSADEPYSIPKDNPFIGVAGVRPEIWSYGLRNPWRFSFDRETGDLWIGDLGQGSLEEVDVAFAVDGAGAGINFGWSAYEGTSRYNEDQSALNHTPPVHEYPHDDGNRAVIGGYVYRGAAIPSMVGLYVFGDYASGRIWALRLDDEDRPDIDEIGMVAGLASFGEDQNGELYVLSSADNKVYRIMAA